MIDTFLLVYFCVYLFELLVKNDREKCTQENLHIKTIKYFLYNYVSNRDITMQIYVSYFFRCKSENHSVTRVKIRYINNITTPSHAIILKLLSSHLLVFFNTKYLRVQ